jgi:hypothetical protein
MEMKRKITTLYVILGMVWWVTGCRNVATEGSELEDLVLDEVVDGGGSPLASGPVEREFWLALAEEPGWHLSNARDFFLQGQTREASEELAKVAAILNFESRHSHSPRETGLLFGSVQEVREVARQLRFEAEPTEGRPSVEEFDRVAALTFRTVAAHQVALARDALEAGDGHMAGRYILETSNSLAQGFDLGGIEMGRAIALDLKNARDLATRMDVSGEGSLDEGRKTLENLEAAVDGLGNVLTGRRK